MTTTVEVLYEDHVLKPLSPIEGLREHERAWVVIHAQARRGVLRQLIGTLSHEDAQTMQEVLDREFEHVEGEW